MAGTKPGHDAGKVLQNDRNAGDHCNAVEGKHTLQKRPWTIVAAIAFLGLAWPTALPAQQALQERLVEQSSGIPAAQVATGRRGMVASQDSQATRIGLNVLERGGNAVDAAVAIGFALAVTVPKAGNIGGGGFMLDIIPVHN